MTASTHPLGLGRVNLDRARFFLARLDGVQRVDPFDSVAAAAYLDAAIVFGNATQEWLADRFGEQDPALRQEAKKRRWLKSVGLWGDPLCKFFAETRIAIVHKDERVDVRFRATRVVRVGAALAVAAGMPVIAHVIPSNPTPEQMAEVHAAHEADLREAARIRIEQEAKVRRLIDAHKARIEAQQREGPGNGNETWVYLDSDDERINGRPAVAVVTDYLSQLEWTLMAQPA